MVLAEEQNLGPSRMQDHRFSSPKILLQFVRCFKSSYHMCSWSDRLMDLSSPLLKLGCLLQVLLHDPGEAPQMKDLAYAVSPGSHTLLASRYTKVHAPVFYSKWPASAKKSVHSVHLATKQN